MDNSARYHLLENVADDHDEPSSSEPQNVVVNEYPVANSSTSILDIESTAHPLQENLLKGSVEMPPDYHIATELPSYEDVERAKVNEERRKIQDEADLLATESALLGTDFLFFTSFFVSFLFNWMGFLLVLCFCHTVAGRYGALAGFGLSLSKWMLIVKHSTSLMSHENDWLWWLVMAFGILICVRASLQYIRAKREWRHLSSSAQERLFYFY